MNWLKELIKTQEQLIALQKEHLNLMNLFEAQSSAKDFTKGGLVEGEKLYAREGDDIVFNDVDIFRNSDNMRYLEFRIGQRKAYLELESLSVNKLEEWIKKLREECQ